MLDFVRLAILAKNWKFFQDRSVAKTLYYNGGRIIRKKSGQTILPEILVVGQNRWLFDVALTSFYSQVVLKKSIYVSDRSDRNTFLILLMYRGLLFYMQPRI